MGSRIGAGADHPDLPRGAYLFVSPHLDDAVLSAGSVIGYLARDAPVVVATVFTEATGRRHGRAARSFLRQCSPAGDTAGTFSSAALFAARRAEDLEVVGRAGALPVHLGYVDALFRRRSWSTGWWGGHLARILPDLAHVYPTHRFDIARGRISAADADTIARVRDDLAGLIDRLEPPMVFAPAGIGRHVDHLIVRDVVLGLCPWATLWADFPYVLQAPDELPAPAAARSPWSWGDGLPGKAELVHGYRTQVDALFRHGVVPQVEESYFGPRPVLAGPAR